MTEREQLGVLKQSTIKLLGEVSTNEAQNALITVLAGFVRLETEKGPDAGTSEAVR